MIKKIKEQLDSWNFI